MNVAPAARTLGRQTEPEACPPAAAFKISLRRNDHDASVGYVNFHALSRGEACLLQPIATQAQIGNLGRS